jgi:hypothetical protein
MVITLEAGEEIYGVVMQDQTVIYSHEMQIDRGSDGRIFLSAPAVGSFRTENKNTEGGRHE